MMPHLNLNLSGLGMDLCLWIAKCTLLQMEELRQLTMVNMGVGSYLQDEANRQNPSINEGKSSEMQREVVEAYP
ncbi:hypothetical protein AMTR_s00061p00115310 [Amborella trichopoda]|uniref:Uncharacterized protein n=1 Tax=Amborella trichopoda TaxID=13333 RepID=U5DCE3_AMBTC|nr:hypothetical protein AMTR_s00061p00115310 [Amborella trichopoda]